MGLQQFLDPFVIAGLVPAIQLAGRWTTRMNRVVTMGVVA